MQSRGTLVRFGAEAVLPSMLALSVFKEIGPVITSLVLAGRLGAGMGAEIGSMRVTEQIDALEVAALKPFHFLVITRGGRLHDHVSHSDPLDRLFGHVWGISGIIDGLGDGLSNLSFDGV